MSLCNALVLSLAVCVPMSACSGKKSAQEVSAPAQEVSATGESSGCGPGLAISADSPIATIDGNEVPCSELMARSRARVMSETAEFDQQIRNIHQENLSELINDYVLKAAADQAGLAVEKFVAANVTVAPTTIDEMHAFYDAAVAAGEKLPVFEEVQDELINFMTEQKQMAALQKFRASLRQKAKIEVDLPILLPPKLAVEAVGPSKGPDSAKVTIVEFSDFQCGFCKKSEATLDRVLATYGDKVRLVYRDYPLPKHAAAAKAAEAAHCAALEGKYWEMHKALFADPSSLSIDDLKASAGALGLDKEAFATCIDSGQMQSKVIASITAGNDLGVNGTPAFFINGRLISGAQPFERFVELIDYELSAN